MNETLVAHKGTTHRPIWRRASSGSSAGALGKTQPARRLTRLGPICHRSHMIPQPGLATPWRPYIANPYYPPLSGVITAVATIWRRCHAVRMHWLRLLGRRDVHQSGPGVLRNDA